MEQRLSRPSREELEAKAKDIVRSYVWSFADHECGGSVQYVCSECDRRVEELAARYIRLIHEAREDAVELCAKIACGPRHDGRGLSHRNQLHSEGCVAIRLAFKPEEPDGK